jgi:hypothetical protein
MRKILFAVGLLVAISAQSEPHFSAITGQSCFLCHENPSGRGMRSLYGSQFFGPTYLPMQPVDEKVLEKLKPQLSESVTIGCDLRTIWMSENTQDKNKQAGLSAPLATNTGTIAQMEGYVYFAFQPTEKFLIYYNQGIATFAGHFEAFGLANVLPLKGYIKAGQFQENYGWIFADHTSFVRTGLFADYTGQEGASPIAPHYALGAEIGFRPKRFDITASLTGEQTSTPVPRDSQKRWFVRAQFQQGIEKLALQFTAGGSWFLAPYKAADPEYTFLSDESKRNEAWGGFAGIGWQGLQERMRCHGGFGFLASSLLFEYDRRAWSPINPRFGQPNEPLYLSPVTSAYSTAQLSVMVQPGVWVLGQYDWMDNGYNVSLDPVNVNFAAHRTTLGFQIFPLPWVELSPRYRVQKLAGIAARDKESVELQAHFIF